MVPAGGCPSAEDLAAYIDGTLSKAESARITEHLASCEDCYAVYMETLHFQLESSAAEPEEVVDAEVRKFRRPSKARPAQEGGALGGSWKSPVRWLPLAALLLIGIGSGTYFQLLAPPQLVTTPATPTIASLPPAEPGTSPLWLGPTHRGVDKEELGIDEASFRMGVQTVNLQATLQAGQVRESEDIIARILQILDTQPFAKGFYDRYAGITAALERKRSPAELLPALPALPEADRQVRASPVERKWRPVDFLPEAARLAQEYRSDFDDTTSLDFGQWVEAGRLAAMARKPAFFQQSDNQRFLRRLRWNDKLGLHDVKLDPTTRESLSRISDIISKSDLQPADYDELKQQLEKILQLLYPES
jgi:Putative zinc-finger